MLYWKRVTISMKKNFVNKIIFFVSFVFIFLFFAHNIKHTVATDNFSYCNTINTHSDSLKISSKYGLPINLFSSERENLIKILCNGDNSVSVHVGNNDSSLYIYKYGYRKVNGKWEKIHFSGKKKAGPWFLGDATVSFNDLSGNKIGKVLVYTCQKVNGKWKCGCRDEKCSKHMWQLQEYSLKGDDFSIDTLSECKSDGDLDIHYPSSYVSYPGDTVVLYGSGFEKCPITEILWNDKVEQKNVTSLTGDSVLITVPELKPGKYTVKAKEGDTFSEFGAVIWIGTKNGYGTKPRIDNITPEVGSQGGTFTIYGEGFTDNNDISTTFGVLKGVASKDGKTLSFEYDPFDEKLVTYERDENGFAKRLEYKLPVNITVINTSGISNVGKFNLSI